MGSKEKICVVSLRKGSIDDEEVDPLDDFLVATVFMTLGADCEDTTVAGMRA